MRKLFFSIIVIVALSCSDTALNCTVDTVLFGISTLPGHIVYDQNKRISSITYGTAPDAMRYDFLNNDDETVVKLTNASASQQILTTIKLKNGLPASSTKPSTPFFSSNLVYNYSDGKLSSWVLHEVVSGAVYKDSIIFDVDNGGNIIKETYYINYNADGTSGRSLYDKYNLYSITVYKYDTGKNPFKGLIFSDYIELEFFFSSNNVINVSSDRFDPKGNMFGHYEKKSNLTYDSFGNLLKVNDYLVTYKCN